MDKHSRGSGLDGGLRAIPAEQLCQTARRTPQTDSSETDAGSPRCFVKRPRREETKHLSPAYCRKNSIITRAECNIVVSQLPNSFRADNHEKTQHRGFGILLTFVFSAQKLWQEKDFIPIIMKYLSSLPNMRRSVAFSFERSAIFSALSRSFWKLLWIFLISSLLVENWAWMSAGRYSYKTNATQHYWHFKSTC